MSNKFSLVALFSVLIVVSSFLFYTRSTPKIMITPERALLDEPIEIVISNLPGNRQVTLEVSSNDKDNNVWKSSAIFQADDKGVVHVAKQAPISGSYSGLDPMGLFWSIKPTAADPSKNTFISQITLNLNEVVLSVVAENKLLAKKTIHRLSGSPDIERKEIQEHGVVGTLFYSKSIEINPGLMIIPGSGGSVSDVISQLLASHGYIVFALNYFGVQGLPEKLSLIPLEYFQNAMQWLKKQPHVDGNKIALMGHSRGAELALLLAATFPGEMNAVVAYSASHVVNSDFLPEQQSAWTYQNTPIPFMPYPSDKEIFNAAKEGHITLHKGTIEDPFQDSEIFLYAMHMKTFKENVKEATIPVENIRCPILIISGDDDKMWPSPVAGNRIIERLESHGAKIKKKHVNYPNAGHNLFIFPYVPSIDLPVHIGSGWSFFGGTPEGNARAHKQVWQEVLHFLDAELH